MLRSLFTIVTAGVSPAALAQSATSPVSGAHLIQVLVGLFAVLAVFALFAVLLKRLNNFQGGRAGTVRVIDGVSLGGRDRVVLLEVEGARILVAQGPGNVRTLHTTNSVSETGDVQAEPAEIDTDGGLGFRDVLGRVSS